MESGEDYLYDKENQYYRTSRPEYKPLEYIQGTGTNKLIKELIAQSNKIGTLLEGTLSKQEEMLKLLMWAQKELSNFYVPGQNNTLDSINKFIKQLQKI